MDNKKIIRSLIFISCLFMSIIIYLTVYQIFYAEDLKLNSYNKRQSEQEEKIIRGNIYDRKGTILANTKVTNGKQERIYPYANLYSQIIGYNSKSYGKSQLERSYNDVLLDIKGFSDLQAITDKLKGEQKVGNSLFLTIDHDLQSYASKVLGNRNGAVVALNPKTGEVLAMVSKPDFNPQSDKLSEQWKNLVDSDDKPLLARATSGLYPPGSTFKVITASAALENGINDFTVNDTGKVNIGGKVFTNSSNHAYGFLNLKSAFTVSSNVYFSQLAVKIGENNLKTVAERYGLNKNISFELPLSKSVFPSNMSKPELGSTGFGQGKTLVSPFEMAMVASAVANNGNLMKPYIVSRVVNSKGEVIDKKQSQLLNNVISPKSDMILKDMMKNVVEAGTGKNARIPGIEVAGKTGTAENELTVGGKSKEHAWFIGFAPYDNPQIAVAVILEYNGSSGGVAAAPVARDVMKHYLGK